jgi:hypothetical protein
VIKELKNGQEVGETDKVGVQNKNNERMKHDAECGKEGFGG